MAKIVGYEEKLNKRFTCSNCTAIVEYAPFEDRYTDRKDEGTTIKGLYCPNCGQFHRTNH